MVDGSHHNPVDGSSLRLEPENGGHGPLEKEIPNLETIISRFHVVNFGGFIHPRWWWLAYRFLPCTKTTFRYLKWRVS